MTVTQENMVDGLAAENHCTVMAPLKSDKEKQQTMISKDSRLGSQPPWLSLIVPSNKKPPRLKNKNLGGFISASSGGLSS
jgi:hypothetical protein